MQVFNMTYLTLNTLPVNHPDFEFSRSAQMSATSALKHTCFRFCSISSSCFILCSSSQSLFGMASLITGTALGGSTTK